MDGNSPANVVDKFSSSKLSTTFLENFRPTVANKSELKVCFYIFQIDKHV